MEIRPKNKAEINKYLLSFSKRIEAALIFQLEYLVESLINHAKSNQGHSLTPTDKYQRTGNLVSSIGGVVVKNGRAVTYKGFVKEKEGNEGVQTGLEFLNSKISEVGTGYGLIVVAGMEYATYVEDYHGLNVLKKSELKMKREIPKVLKVLKNKIDKPAA